MTRSVLFLLIASALVFHPVLAADPGPDDGPASESTLTRHVRWSDVHETGETVIQAPSTPAGGCALSASASMGPSEGPLQRGLRFIPTGNPCEFRVTAVEHGLGR